jgi:hypothetical protein
MARAVPALLLSLLTACTAFSGSGPAPAGADLAIRDVAVVDVERGRILPGRTVLVRGNRIIAVETSDRARVPAGARVVDGGGKYLIPGLWDMHVHAARAGRAPLFWPLFIAHGVTGIRETGSFTDSLLHWRAASREPGVLAPRIVWSSPMLDGDPPLYSHGIAIRTPAEARAVVARMQALGFDYLKVYSGIPRDAFHALADEAQLRGVVIAGEVPNSVQPLEAAAAGMRSFEHLWNLFEACVPGAYALRDSLARLDLQDAPESERRAVRDAQYRRWLDGYDPACAHSLAVGVRRTGTYQVPTLVINRSYSLMDSTWTDDPRRKWVPGETLAEWDELRTETLEEYGPLGIAAWRARYAHEIDMLRRMADAGVEILAGSDASDEPFVYVGASLHDELALFVEAGLTPLQALQSATLNPARYLKATDSLGTVAPGRFADLVLLDANPLADITNTARIHAVVLNGRLLIRAELDRLLDEAEAIARAR